MAALAGPVRAAAAPAAPAGAHVGGAAARAPRHRAVGRPTLLAGKATPLLRFDAVLTARDEECLAGHQGIDHRRARSFEDTADRLARHAHRLRRRFVTESFEVDQSHGFELVDGESQLFEFACRDTRGFEQSDARHAPDGAFDRWSRHYSASPDADGPSRLASAQPAFAGDRGREMIMSICPKYAVPPRNTSQMVCSHLALDRTSVKAYI